MPSWKRLTKSTPAYNLYHNSTTTQIQLEGRHHWLGIVRDDDREDILLLTIELSKWILAEAKSRPPNTALMMNTFLVISVEAYASLLRSILAHLTQKGRPMDHKVEKALKDQLDNFVELFKENFSMARSTGSYVLPSEGDFSASFMYPIMCINIHEENPSFFCNASNFTINGGTFIGHIPGTDHRGAEFFQSASDDNSAVIRGDIVRLQEMILRAMNFNIAIIVLFSERRIHLSERAVYDDFPFPSPSDYIYL
ncbi:uncharacterized protein LACBIDRAFT_293786 [Laccaria bicolor S238N-H82]|uniref:Predicted protein n=1 Tax=Laccaria bicolor (strain S238N-H82 / ATCC MYA-4686) TaxID=486041 RepID=B0D6K3_LACBS|nr:uncharacterized protein LACBIDRAFT_293786 [Laccaria bicolor S238N-H82]EDR09971.1 predicted protein [Laccaria bicolor S238N-H82]|eukprot:XP_001879356.1 predicted protein [Laccaria bicolor S238N-H82]